MTTARNRSKPSTEALTAGSGGGEFVALVQQQVSGKASNAELRSMPPSALTIAGSDSGGGAGIQADLKTFGAFGIHGTSVVTALTAQNTRAVAAVQVIRPSMVARQIEAVFDDFDVRALKIGMLGDRTTIRAVSKALARQRSVPVVLDPVMVASSGAVLLESGAIGALTEELLPLATLVTPNGPEAELLLGRKLPNRRGLPAAARALLALGPHAVLLKGGHIGRGDVEDHLVGPHGHRVFRHPRLAVDGHGTGCTLSAAVAAGLALGSPLERAVADAIDYVHRALLASYRPGKGGVSVLGHLSAVRARAT